MKMTKEDKVQSIINRLVVPTFNLNNYDPDVRDIRLDSDLSNLFNNRKCSMRITSRTREPLVNLYVGDTANLIVNEFFINAICINIELSYHNNQKEYTYSFIKKD